ncbi:MAG: repeat protein, partial [Spartobacteria bacterium]|nr:repeat protein [Spartobacteria bacterium]
LKATTIPPTNDYDSAIVRSLAPGAYTAVLAGKGATTGVGLVEVYDLDLGADSRLANIATRGRVGDGDDVLICGTIAVGNGTTTVLFRALGPSTGVPGALNDPTLELHDGQGATIATNDNWQDTQAAAIQNTTIPPNDPREAAILRDLTPGAYTAVVRGKNGTTGVAVIDAYQLN